jgi:hypothetical protein
VNARRTPNWILSDISDRPRVFRYERRIKFAGVHSGRLVVPLANCGSCWQ